MKKVVDIIIPSEGRLYKIFDNELVSVMPNPYVFGEDIQKRIDAGEIKFIVVKRELLAAEDAEFTIAQPGDYP